MQQHLWKASMDNFFSLSYQRWPMLPIFVPNDLESQTRRKKDKTDRQTDMRQAVYGQAHQPNYPQF